MSRVRRLVLVVAVLTVGAGSARAQTVFGTFSWQMEPYCNTVTLSLISMPTGFTVEGVEDQCGNSNKASAVGTAAFNILGNLRINFTIGLPSPQPVQVTADVSTANGEGAWTDSNGHAGTFRFFGATPGLPPRPDHEVFFHAGGQSSTMNGSRVVFTDIIDNRGGGAYDAVTGVYTVPVGGLYSITYSVAWNPGAATASRACAHIRTTTATVERASCIAIVGGSGDLALSGATVVSLAAGHTISVEASAPAGVTLEHGPVSGGGLTVLKVH
jgi:hypothetical protein